MGNDVLEADGGGISAFACGEVEIGKAAASRRTPARSYLLGLIHTMSYARSNVTNIRHCSFAVQVNQCGALLGIMAKPPGPSTMSAMPSMPVDTVPFTINNGYCGG